MGEPTHLIVERRKKAKEAQLSQHCSMAERGPWSQLDVGVEWACGVSYFP